ncbi:MAG: hypothetical protein ACLRL6_01360 [Clostridium sp.]
MMQVQSHIDVLQPSAALTQVFCRLEDDSQDARVQKRPLDVFLEGRWQRIRQKGCNNSWKRQSRV